MEDKVELVKELFTKAEDFAKTNIELYKLKAIDKGTDIFAAVAAWVTIGIIFLLLIIIGSVGLALWLGEVLGKPHYGFFAVAGIYLVVMLVMFFTRANLLEKFFNDYMVKMIFKEKKR